MSEESKKKVDSLGRDISEAWIINPAGVKSCTYKYLADMFISTRPGWKYAEPDYVPEKKVYPMDGDFTKQGLERRIAILTKAKELREAEVDNDNSNEQDVKLEDLTYKQLQALATEKGIKAVGAKKDELIERLK